ncbi:MAG: D-alanyl-D-alanine carboxypeptidase [Clostridiales bacterium]|jgi:D-alanyl-D-alanine carboxypeptidase (penicillin-binding protein 5/6)|nr:D-alanyl-D-alanine carboxypeptidase [Clostridiales bacterium]
MEQGGKNFVFDGVRKEGQRQQRQKLKGVPAAASVAAALFFAVFLSVCAAAIGGIFWGAGSRCIQNPSFSRACDKDRRVSFIDENDGVFFSANGDCMENPSFRYARNEAREGVFIDENDGMFFSANGDCIQNYSFSRACNKARKRSVSEVKNVNAEREWGVKPYFVNAAAQDINSEGESLFKPRFVNAAAQDINSEEESLFKPRFVNAESANAENNAARSSYIAMEQDSKRVLYGSNINAKLPMASTTKIMTAILAIEKNDVKNKIKIPKGAVGIEGSSMYLKENEEMTLEDLLYGLMLTSGNDSAAAIAIATAGGVEKFAALMNERARELGAVNTNFVNPHGLHHADHYTTAYDLALITAHALQNPIFQTIVSSEKYVVKGADGTAARYLHNKNKMLKMYDGADGVKTGFTKNSGRCLVSSAKRGDMRVVTVVLNHSDMWNDSVSLLDRSFASYKLQKILGAENGTEIPVEGGTRNFAAALPRDKFYPLRADEKITYEIEREKLNAPVKIGEIGGKIKISIDNRLLFEEKLYTIDSVKEKSVLDHFREWFRSG